jgi:hypothetical protein
MPEDYFRYKQFKKKPGRFFYLTATVMFIDIVGFTKHGDNEGLRNVVRRLQETIDDVFERLRWDEEQGANDAIMIPTGDGYGIGFEPSSRVPHPSRSLRRVGFHETHPIRILTRVSHDPNRIHPASSATPAATKPTAIQRRWSTRS